MISDNNTFKDNLPDYKLFITQMSDDELNL